MAGGSAAHNQFDTAAAVIGMMQQSCRRSGLKLGFFVRSNAWPPNVSGGPSINPESTVTKGRLLLCVDDIEELLDLIKSQRLVDELEIDSLFHDVVHSLDWTEGKRFALVELYAFLGNVRVNLVQSCIHLRGLG